MPRIRELSALRPEWIAEKGRDGLGLELDCPVHGAHRISLWFANPLDGGEPPGEALVPLYWRTGDDIPSLSILEVVEVGGHWRGWILEGRVFTSLEGLAW